MSVPTKVLSTLAVLALVGLSTVACSSGATPSTSSSDSSSSKPEETKEEAPAPEPVDLTGEWKQSNPNSEENFQTATITGDTIEVYWNAPDTKSLYWAGTVDATPADGNTSFTWDSVNDKSKTDGAMLASGDDTKTFTYKDGELSYDVTAMGTTMTVRLAKQ